MYLSVLCHLDLLQQLNQSKRQAFAYMWSVISKPGPVPAGEAKDVPKSMTKMKMSRLQEQRPSFSLQSCPSQQKFKKHTCKQYATYIRFTSTEKDKVE